MDKYIGRREQEVIALLNDESGLCQYEMLKKLNELYTAVNDGDNTLCPSSINGAVKRLDRAGLIELSERSCDQPLLRKKHTYQLTPEGGDVYEMQRRVSQELYPPDIRGDMYGCNTQDAPDDDMLLY